jgi:hypothetical protein
MKDAIKLEKEPKAYIAYTVIKLDDLNELKGIKYQKSNKYVALSLEIIKNKVRIRTEHPADLNVGNAWVTSKFEQMRDYDVVE